MITRFRIWLIRLLAGNEIQLMMNARFERGTWMFDNERSGLMSGCVIIAGDGGDA